MNDSVLIALIKKIIDESISNLELPSPERGPRGFRGRPGADFVFEEHQDFIVSQISELVEKSKLKFSDLTPEEIDALKGERGARGLPGARGPAGDSFVFDEHEDKINSIITNYISELKEHLKLKFEDLSEFDKESLKGDRGPRGFKGQRGKPGKDFDFEEHKEFFESLAPEKLKFSDLTEAEKSELKLTFDCLSDDEKESLRGDRGLRGFRGQKGRPGNDGKDGESIVGPRGVQGLPGVPGVTGMTGPEGPAGKDGKEIIDVELHSRGDEFYLEFLFSDGTVSFTNAAKFPRLEKTVTSIVAAISQAKDSEVESVEKIIATYTAVGDISALKWVVSAGGNSVELADWADAQGSEVLGISLTAALDGNDIDVLSFGTLSDTNFNSFSLNNSIFLGDNASVTQLAPTVIDGAAFQVDCGKYLGQNTIFVNIEPTIEL